MLRELEQFLLELGAGFSFGLSQVWMNTVIGAQCRQGLPLWLPDE